MSQWVEEEFATAQTGDERLTRRLKLMIERMAASPLASIASAFRGWAEVTGAYRFLAHPRTEVQTVLEPHRDATLRRVQSHSRVLLLQDTSELDYTAKKALKGTGPLGETHRQGFFAHNQLVISPERLPLGVWGTEIYARDEEEHGKADTRKHKAIEEKESYRWLQGYREACELGRLAPETQVIACGDRESDIYEIFSERKQREERGEPVAEWLIRCNQNRRIQIPLTPEAPEPPGRIREAVAGGERLGTLCVTIRAKEQSKKIQGNRKKVFRSARVATLEVRVATVELRAPYRKGGKLPAVRIRVLEAHELDPPPGDEPIDWVLLSSLPVVDLEDALDLIHLYVGRWEIEVFHRVLKTGCRVEELQLKTDQSIKVAIAIYMVVAWRVLYLMKVGRECPELPCDVVFEEDEWQSLWVLCHGPEAIRQKPSLGEFLTQVAILGGFLGRKADGSPGPQVLWQGLSRLRDFALAWRVFRAGHPPFYDSPPGS